MTVLWGIKNIWLGVQRPDKTEKVTGAHDDSSFVLLFFLGALTLTFFAFLLVADGTGAPSAQQITMTCDNPSFSSGGIMGLRPAQGNEKLLGALPSDAVHPPGPESLP
jgi:hypothetical protein